MNVCWVDDLICRPPDSNVCDREGDFCYRVYRTMSAGCIKMRWSPQDPDEPGPGDSDDAEAEVPVPVRHARAAQGPIIRYSKRLLDNSR